MVDTHGDSSSSDYQEDAILKSVLARKEAQKAKKSQPWKTSYVPKTEDKPLTNSPHDKPWIREGATDPNWNWGGEEYDTDRGKT